MLRNIKNIKNILVISTSSEFYGFVVFHSLFIVIRFSSLCETRLTFDSRECSCWTTTRAHSMEFLMFIGRCVMVLVGYALVISIVQQSKCSGNLQSPEVHGNNQNEYLYSLKRDDLVEAERRFEQQNTILNEVSCSFWIYISAWHPFKNYFVVIDPLDPVLYEHLFFSFTHIFIPCTYIWILQ